jgi:RimJ/RimL family protein N-acetyltransferase
MNSVSIELISAPRIVSYRECVGSVAREKKFLPVGIAFPLDDVEAFVLNNISGGVAHYVAVHDGAVVGWCDIIPRDPEFLRHVGRLGMGLLCEYRRMGLGGRLIDAALSHARQTGLEKIELEVFASNTAAIALYEKKGFVREGLLRKAGKIDGVYDDVVLMGMIF